MMIEKKQRIDGGEWTQVCGCVETHNCEVYERVRFFGGGRCFEIQTSDERIRFLRLENGSLSVKSDLLDHHISIPIQFPGVVAQALVEFIRGDAQDIIHDISCADPTDVAFLCRGCHRHHVGSTERQRDKYRAALDDIGSGLEGLRCPGEYARDVLDGKAFPSGFEPQTPPGPPKFSGAAHLDFYQKYPTPPDGGMWPHPGELTDCGV
jgi:hypothetical protein